MRENHAIQLESGSVLGSWQLNPSFTSQRLGRIWCARAIAVGVNRGNFVWVYADTDACIILYRCINLRTLSTIHGMRILSSWIRTSVSSIVHTRRCNADVVVLSRVINFAALNSIRSRTQCLESATCGIKTGWAL